MPPARRRGFLPAGWRSRARGSQPQQPEGQRASGQPLGAEPSSRLRLLGPPRSCDSALSPPLLLRCSSPPRPLPSRAAGPRPPPPRASSPPGVPESPQGVSPRPRCSPSVRGAAYLLGFSSRSVDSSSVVVFFLPTPTAVCLRLEALGCWGSGTHTA